MSAELIHQMYIAYYQRPADPAGLIYWQDQLNANGGGEAGWNAVAAAFANAAESTALYGTQTLGQKISAIYVAAFERAASADEIAYWEASGFNAAQIGFAIVNGAQNDDLRTVTKKVDYAEAFVSQIDPAGTGVGPFSFQYVDPSLGRNLLDVVTKDSDVSTSTVASQVSSTLPTLVTVNLTSGNDTVTPTANAAESINAALGGSSPTLSRADQIDGGSASDSLTVAMDGNFLLGFGAGGYMRDVEEVNLAATASSVTPKTFNFTGVSGVETVNVGAANAVINLNNISDTGITVNLSGQATGTFEIGYATGAISGSGSSMTIGVTDVGSEGNNVTVLANGITELNMASYGTKSYVNLGNSVNDIASLVVTGTGAVDISNVPDGISGFDASGLGGDLKLTLNVDEETALVGSTNTISGGGGHDALELNGSAIFAATGTSIEELVFDGASGEAIVRATGLASLTTITISGTQTQVPSISGLHSSGLTVNAIHDTASPSTYVFSAGGALTVNLDVDPSKTTQSDNDFTFRTTTTDGVTVNVGTNVSANGTYNLQKASSVDISFDSTSDFGATINHSSATTLNVSGGGTITGATFSGDTTTSLNVNAASAQFAYGSSAIQAATVSVDGGFGFNSGTNLTGLETLTVTVGKSGDLTSASTMDEIDTIVLNGAGSSAYMALGNIDKSALGALTVDVNGMALGFSANTIEVVSGAVTIAAGGSTGSLDVAKISATDAVTIEGGSLGGFSAGTITSSGAVTIDLAARSATSTGDLTLTTLGSSSAVTLNLGSGNGSAAATITGAELASTFTMDGSQFGGTMEIGKLSASGNITISLGTLGDLSASGTLSTVGNLVIDGTNASTAQLTLAGAVSSNGATTISLGEGSGAVSANAINVGSLTYDASNFAGTTDLQGVTASGNVVVSVGGLGAFSANSIASTAGNVIVDASNAASAAINLAFVSSSGNLTVSGGSGSGSIVSSGDITVGGNFTFDSSNYGGTTQFKDVSASGSVIMSIGGDQGHLSASGVNTTTNFTLDAANSSSAGISLHHVTASGNVTMSLGSGSGSITLSTAEVGGNFVLDASSGKAAIDIDNADVSGNATVSLGGDGDFSGSILAVGGNLTIDGGAALSADITAKDFTAGGNMTVAVGQGTGTIALAAAGQGDVDGNFTLDAANYNGNVDITSLSVSGTVTMSVGGVGSFTADKIVSASTATFDFSNQASAAAASITEFSGGTLSVTLGGASGGFSSNAILSDSSITIDGTNSKGAMTFGTVTASGAISITLGGVGEFSASDIGTAGSFTLDNSTGTSGKVVSQIISGSGAITINLGAGSGLATFSAINAFNSLSITGANNGDVDIASASGVKAATINLTGTGSVVVSSMETGGAFTLSAYLGNDGSTEEAMTLNTVTASGIAITLAGGSGAIAASILTTTANFSLDTTASIEVDTQHDITSLSASGMTITLGLGDNLNVSTMGMAGTGVIDMTSSSDFTNTAYTGGTTNTLTVNHAGGGDVNFSSLTVGNGFTYNGTGLTTGSTFSAVTINTSQTGGVVFNYGEGSRAFISASTVTTTGVFEINGANLTTAEIAFTTITASGSVTINMGSAGGELQISAIQSQGGITINAGNTSTLNFDVGASLSASGTIAITLGSQSAAADATRVSSIATDSTFTLSAGSYRERFDVNDISGSAATITFGDLSDGFSASTISVTSLDFNGGTGANFSATIQDLDISAGSGWNITMAELGNGLTINQLSFAKSGTVRATAGSDTAAERDYISADSASAASDEITVNFYLGDDSSQDDLFYQQGGGADIVKIHNFTAGTDDLTTKGTSASNTYNNLTTAQALGILGEALNTTISTGDTTYNASSAVFTYNSSSWLIVDDGTDDASFGNADIVFQFVGVTGVNEAGDVTFV